MGWPSPSDKSKKWDKDEKAFEEKSYYTKIGERRERNWDPKYDIPEKDPHYTDKRDKRNRRATKIIVVIIMGVIASMLLFGEILENPLAENPSEESNIIVDEKLIQDLTREQSDITNIDASTDALHSYFNDRYLREDYRFMIKHYDWKVVYDNTEQVYRENTKNFGEMESVVFFANSNDSGKQGFVEIMRQVENSHTMIDTLPYKDLTNIMMDEVETWCNWYYVNATCEVIFMDGSITSKMIGPPSETDPTQTKEFLSILRLKYENGEEIDLWKWYRLWNDPYDGRLMWAQGLTFCDPVASKQFEELTCKQVTNQTAKFEPKTIHILRSLQIMELES